MILMTKYDNLDPRIELEQIITEDLIRALEKREFTVQHGGTRSQPAPASKPDIVVFDRNTRINIEVTKTTKSSADREFLSIKDHLLKTKRLDSTRKCFVVYVSPETHYRMMNACRDFCILNEDKEDSKIMPLCFENFELLITKLIQSHKERYTKKELLSLFKEYRHFVDDERILGILYDKLFSDDAALRKELETKEESKHQKTIEELIKNLLKLEDDLREHQGITHIAAIRNIIFLVFIKLYEEKREFEGKENRFKLETFRKFQEFENEEETKRAVHALFEKIKSDPELVKAKVFTEIDFLDEKLDDDFVVDFFIEPFEKYHFYTTKVDGIGAAYEVLGMRTGKDVKAGQFFTPENVVQFMVKMAELHQDDVILDPACGTARFLIYAMEEMKKNLEKRNRKKKLEEIKTKQLFGSDYDLNVAKLAKMNMYIHGDGKANIMDKDGLLLYDLDGKIDAILTNPPLGPQSFARTSYDDDFRLRRMEVIPKRNATRQKLKEYMAKLKGYEKLLEFSRSQQKPKDAKRYAAMVKKCNRRILELETKIRNGKSKLVVRGSQMKGGALFVGAAKHYLKSVRDSSAALEWRGGKLLIILDEGVLNTTSYKEVRDFIKKYFYIKAIISLTRETFVPVSNTSTKTSILYAIKKEDPDALQQEPIFFAHAEKVGIDSKKRVCPNHLFNSGDSIFEKFREFKEKVLASYDGIQFNRQRFLEHGFTEGKIHV